MAPGNVCPCPPVPMKGSTYSVSFRCADADEGKDHPQITQITQLKKSLELRTLQFLIRIDKAALSNRGQSTKHKVQSSNLTF